MPIGRLKIPAAEPAAPCVPSAVHRIATAEMLAPAVCVPHAGRAWAAPWPAVWQRAWPLVDAPAPTAAHPTQGCAKCRASSAPSASDARPASPASSRASFGEAPNRPGYAGEFRYRPSCACASPSSPTCSRSPCRPSCNGRCAPFRHDPLRADLCLQPVARACANDPYPACCHGSHCHLAWRSGPCRPWHQSSLRLSCRPSVRFARRAA